AVVVGCRAPEVDRNARLGRRDEAPRLTLSSLSRSHPGPYFPPPLTSIWHMSLGEDLGVEIQVLLRQRMLVESREHRLRLRRLRAAQLRVVDDRGHALGEGAVVAIGERPGGVA